MLDLFKKLLPDCHYNAILPQPFQILQSTLNSGNQTSFSEDNEQYQLMQQAPPETSTFTDLTFQTPTKKRSLTDTQITSLLSPFISLRSSSKKKVITSKIPATPNVNCCPSCKIVYERKADAEFKKNVGERSWTCIGCDVNNCSYWGISYKTLCLFKFTIISTTNNTPLTLRSITGT